MIQRKEARGETQTNDSMNVNYYYAVLLFSLELVRIASVVSRTQHNEHHRPTAKTFARVSLFYVE